MNAAPSLSSRARRPAALLGHALMAIGFVMLLADALYLVVPESRLILRTEQIAGWLGMPALIVGVVAATAGAVIRRRALRPVQPSN